MPNIRISAALAEYRLKRADESRASLRGAVQDFPWIFAQLFKELNIEHIPKSIWGKEPRTERERLESASYVHRAKDLWNTPDTISFLVEVVDTTEASRNPPLSDQPITINEARHILLSGIPQLLALIPRSYTTMSSSSSDPLPPPDNIESYTTTLPTTNRMPVSAYHGPFDSDNDTSDAEEMAPPLRPPQTPPQTANPADPTDEEEPDPATERGIRGFFSRFLAWPNPNSGRPPQQQQIPSDPDDDGNDDIHQRLDELVRQAAAEEDDPTPDPEEEAYDEDANKRWLAGRGMLQLKDFVEQHGAEAGAWSRGEIEGEGRALVGEYVRRVKLLREVNRRFILEYALRQGAGEGVRGLVGRFL